MRQFYDQTNRITLHRLFIAKLQLIYWVWAPARSLPILLLFFCHLSGLVRAQAPLSDTLYFTADSTAQLIPLYGGQSAFADFNSDGLMDLLMTGMDKDSIAQTYLYIQIDSSRFIQTTTLIAGLHHSTVALADFNNDIFIDVILTGTDTQGIPRTLLYANKGNASFELKSVTLPALLHGNLLFTDLNSDGRKDIFMNGLDKNGVPVTKILHNKDAEFSEVMTSIPGRSHGSVVQLDDNQDGRTDLFIDGMDSTGKRSALLFYSQGKFKFKADSVALEGLNLERYTADSLHIDSLSYSGAVAGDFNHDGRADLLLTGKGNDGKIYSQVYLRQQKVFVAAPLELEPVHSGTSWLADLDNDGRTDILLSGLNESGKRILQLYRNVSEDSLNVVELPFAVASGVRYALGDYTNDGNLDLLQTGLSDGADTLITHLYRNTTQLLNNGALPPVDAEVMTLGDKAVFTWSVGSDDRTPAAALSYDLYITLNGGYPQLKASEANTGSYLRWVVSHGSQGQTSSCVIEGLPEGDFIWDIISVDNAFQSGVRYVPGGGGGGGGGTPRTRRFKICDNIIRIDTTICIQSNLALSTALPATWYSEKHGVLAKNSTRLNYQVTESDTLFAMTMVANKCTEEKRYVIRASKPGPFSLGDDQTVCANEPLALTAAGNWKKVQWYVQGKGMVQESPALSYPIAAETEVWAQVTDQYGCVSGDTIRVQVHEVPLVLGNQVSVLEGEAVPLTISGGVSYQWSPATGLSDPTSANPEASPAESTTYYVTITTAKGCTVRDSIRVTVNKIPPDIFIPSLFTPNGDGKNDDFRVYGAAFRELTLQVYDRSGSLVYETRDVKEALNRGWDGQSNGSPQPNGSYVWIIQGTFNDGTEVKYQGKTSGIINLMR
jgi:gliding motility-associated-like protein